MNNPVANLILRGRVYFGNALVAGYDIEHISIVETYRGLQELHLHGFKRTEEWDDELKVAYQLETDGIDPIMLLSGLIQPDNVREPGVVKNPLHVQVNILRLREGTWNPTTEDYDWKDLNRRVRFNGRIVMARGDHIVMKPIEEGLTAEALAQAFQAIPLMANKASQVFVNSQTLKDIGAMN